MAKSLATGSFRLHRRRQYSMGKGSFRKIGNGRPAYGLSTCWFLAVHGHNPRARAPHTLVSDSPYDYLTLYSNTLATFSDRVHACIVTLAYGHPARLFVGYNDPDPSVFNRMLLFEKVGANAVASKLTYSDTERMEKAKKSQVRFLYELLAHV